MGWVRETEKSGLLENQVSNFGAGVELATGILHGPSSPLPPVRGGAAGLNTWWGPFLGCFLPQESGHAIAPELRAVNGLHCGMKEKTRSELRRLTICLLLFVWPWTNLVLSLEFSSLFYKMK